MKKFAIIVAGGSGTRMNSPLPKQFLLINGKPVLYYTIRAFLKAFIDINIVLVLPVDHISIGREIIRSYFENDRIQVTTGGKTRFHSVKNGLGLVEPDSIVFVHDAVRSLVSIDLINRCYEGVLEFGTAVPVIMPKDSIRIITPGGNLAVPRDQVRLIQTPQAFYSKILLPAFNIEYQEQFTDEATVVEAFGEKIHLVEGDANNMKITLPIDLEIAGRLLSEIQND